MVRSTIGKPDSVIVHHLMVGGTLVNHFQVAQRKIIVSTFGSCMNLHPAQIVHIRDVHDLDAVAISQGAALLEFGYLGFKWKAQVLF